MLIKSSTLAPMLLLRGLSTGVPPEPTNKEDDEAASRGVMINASGRNGDEEPSRFKVEDRAAREPLASEILTEFPAAGDGTTAAEESGGVAGEATREPGVATADMESGEATAERSSEPDTSEEFAR